MICYDGEGVPDVVKAAPQEWEQDGDVLDTWFSSALWPFSTLGWPEKTAELARFYPNSVLVTGHDILFFWVARMIFMGETLMDKPPFPETFLHGLIYGKSYWRKENSGHIHYVSSEEQCAYDVGKPVPPDVQSKWEKMSKSKGNIIDPIEMIDQYGTDAVRMALCASATQARQIDLDRRKFEEFKNFSTKIWNGARFVFMNLDTNEPLTGTSLAEGLNLSELALEDRWILTVLRRTVADVNRCIERYHFDQAALGAYDFFWKEFCAYYLELSKPILFGKRGDEKQRLQKQKILVIILCQAVRLLHPMAPFITEELFQTLKERIGTIVPTKSCDPWTKECIEALQSTACIIAPYPQLIDGSRDDAAAMDEFSLMEELIYAIRNMRGEMNLSPGMATSLYIVGDPADRDWQTVQKNRQMIEALIKTNLIECDSLDPSVGFASTAVHKGLKIFMPLPTEMIEQEKQRLEKELIRLATALSKIEEQLKNRDFIERAPQHVIEKLQKQHEQTNQEHGEIEKRLDLFKN